MNRAERRAARFNRPVCKPSHGSKWAKRLQQRQERIERERLQAQLTDRASAEFESQITTTRIQLLSIEDGQDATELLGKLSVVIGTPMQYAYTISGDKGVPPWAGQLRGALKTIIKICTEGYAWQEEYALALERAVEIAAEADFEVSDLKQWEQAWMDACYLCMQIERHAITGTEVI